MTFLEENIFYTICSKFDKIKKTNVFLFKKKYLYTVQRKLDCLYTWKNNFKKYNSPLH